MLFGDDYGREAMVGRRDAYWASGGSAITNSLLLSAVWVVGAVFADRNAPALGGIFNQQGVDNSTGVGRFCYLMTRFNLANMPRLVSPNLMELLQGIMRFPSKRAH